jgi:hypothetical protein
MGGGGKRLFLVVKEKNKRKTKCEEGTGRQNKKRLGT